MNTQPKSPEAIALLESKLHIPCQYGPWWTARRLLQEVWKKNPRVIRDTSYDLRDLPFNEAGRDIQWKRDITPDMIGKNVHHLDKNSQYLAADRSVYTGIADPCYISGPATPGRPGIYHVASVSIPDSCIFDGEYFPKIIEDGQEWVTNDVLLYALKQNCEVEVIEAWVFEDYKRVLDTWALTIWNARSALKGVNDEAYQFMKLVAIVGNGGWAASKEKHPGLDLIHPNWWCDTVGQARTALLANLAKYGSPLLVETDGLYYVSTYAYPQTAVPGILDRAGSLGGYKHCSSFHLTEEMYAQSQTMGVGELAHMFKVAGGEKE